MSRVVLTGATGFVGRHTLEALAHAGHEVHAVARSAEPASDRVRWHAADLLEDGGAATTTLMDAIEPELLVHLAWYAEHAEFWSSPQNVRWVEASLALLRAFADAGGRRAVIAGTCAEYDWSHEQLDEGAPLRPATLYGAAKHGLHTVAQAFCEEVGVELAWGRLFFLYGPGEDPHRFVSSIVLALLRGDPAPMTAGTQLRDFLYAADAGAAFAALADSDVVGAVNIAAGRAIALRELGSEIARRIDGAKLQLGALPMAPGDPPALLTEARRLREEVGWRPAIDIGEGLDQVIAWWRQQNATGAPDHSSADRRARGDTRVRRD